MGVNHPTVEPSNVSMDTKRTRLMRDLEALETVDSVSDDVVGENTITFEASGPMPGDIETDVLRVLADHDAFLPAEQPGAKRKHAAFIHTR